MGFLSFIGSAISAAVSVVTKVASVVGSVIKETAKTMIEWGVEKLRLVADVIETVSKLFGIIKPEDNIDDIGDRAMRCDRRAEEFDSTSEYIDYLKENVEASDLEKLSEHDKLARKAIGSALMSKAISEKLSLEIPIEFWKVGVEAGLSAKELDSFLKQFKKDGIKPEDFVKYLKQELEEKEEEKVEDVLVLAYKELEPTADIKEIEEKVVSLPYTKVK